MKNFSFVIWMIFFPISISIGNYLAHLEGVKYSESTEVISAIVMLVIWIGVGYLVYEKNNQD